MSGHSIPPLPPQLERGAKELREREPPSSFALRLERALDQEERTSPRTLASLWAASVIFLPAVAAAVLLLHVMIRGDSIDGVEPLSRFEEHHVVLDEDGDAWVELDLWTHEHGSAATVQVDTPASGVHVDTTADRACSERRCRHSFVNAKPAIRAPLRVRVTEPGRHSITVEHSSPSKRVRETFLVYAR